MNNDKLLIIAFKIKRAKNRETVFMNLEEPIMPSELVKKIHGKVSHTHFAIVSKALVELAKLKVIRVVNPKEKRGRIYEQTALGKKVKKLMRK